jgi:hypothetical protein
MPDSLIAGMQYALQTNIEKIDVNDPDLHQTIHPGKAEALAQAAIPSVLIGALIHLAKQKEPSAHIPDMDTVFAQKSSNVVEAIANYAHTTKEEAGAYISRAIAVLNQMATDDHRGEGVALMRALENQQSDILKYLPSDLNIGSTLGIELIDDRTHKMEGPLSSIANYFFIEHIHNKKSDEALNNEDGSIEGAADKL